jgi:membrane-associated phospholipid phosphatase
MPSLTTAAANPSDARILPARSGEAATRRTALFACLWLLAITTAFALDRSLAVGLRDSGIASAIKFGGWPKDVAKFSGYFWAPLIIAVALLIWHPLHARAAMFISLCALVAGSNSIVKWLVGRYRPFFLPPIDLPQPFRCFPFNGGIAGLFHQASGLSFVSGHTALAFATATGMRALFPRSRTIVFLFYAIAVIVLLERVGENAHWLSDAVCGAALGVFGVKLLARCCGGWLLA